MNDRYKLDLFYETDERVGKYPKTQQIPQEVHSMKEIHIAMLAMDFPNGTTGRERKELEQRWTELLPTLDKVTGLSVRHRVGPAFFEAICKMKNLETLVFWASPLGSIAGIGRLKKLQFLQLGSFSKLVDLSPLAHLGQLKQLCVQNSFKIDIDTITKVPQLIGFRLSGEQFGTRRFPLKSLQPFTELKKLRHLDLTNVTIKDKSYDSLLQMKHLERLDITSDVPLAVREKIKAQHKTLRAGFFMDWNFEKKEYYDGKDWKVLKFK